MTQMTVRTTDELLNRVRRFAQMRGTSINEFVTRTLDAATNPDLATSEAQQTRERLAAAGLLSEPHAPASEPPSEEVLAAARRAAGRGTPLSQLVSEGRG